MKTLSRCLVPVALTLMCCAGCATRSGAPIGPIRWEEDAPSLAEVAAQYRGRCACGKRLSNNCAHFLSDAFIEAGYRELLKDQRVGARCESGRVIRAQDMLRWFQEHAERFHQGIPPKNTGIWAAYQEKGNRHHVFLLDTATGKYYGTDNCVNWPIQWYYQW